MSEIPSAYGFDRWLQKQPPDEYYEYVSNTDCPIGLYLKSIGHTEIEVEGWGIWRSDQGKGQFAKIAEVLNPSLGGARTYGAALERLRYMED